MLLDCTRIVIGIGEARVLKDEQGLIVTHALGSCLGISIFDPVARVGGLLHAQLPASSHDRARAAHEPAVFVDTGVPLLFRTAQELGAEKRRLRVAVAGGAAMGLADGAQDCFNIGQRNLTVLRKLFWMNCVLIAAEDSGGTTARTMGLDLATGRTLIEAGGRRYEL